MTTLSTADIEISVFIQSIGAYNAGALVGRWLRLPVSPEYLQKQFDEVTEEAAQAVGIDAGDEIEAGDIETTFSPIYSELAGMSPFGMNELAEELAELLPDQEQRFSDIYPYFGNTEDALQAIDSALIVEADDRPEELAIACYQAGYLPEAMTPPQYKEQYWDWEQVGYDLKMNGWAYNDAGKWVYSE